MADKFSITNLCRRCDGTGLHPYQSGGNFDGSCPKCQGTGFESGAYVDLTDLVNKLNDIQNKVNDIFEKGNKS